MVQKLTVGMRDDNPVLVYQIGYTLVAHLNMVDNLSDGIGLKPQYNDTDDFPIC